MDQRLVDRTAVVLCPMLAAGDDAEAEFLGQVPQLVDHLFGHAYLGHDQEGGVVFGCSGDRRAYHVAGRAHMPRSLEPAHLGEVEGVGRHAPLQQCHFRVVGRHTAGNPGYLDLVVLCRAGVVPRREVDDVGLRHRRSRAVGAEVGKGLLGADEPLAADGAEMNDQGAPGLRIEQLEVGLESHVVAETDRCAFAALELPCAQFPGEAVREPLGRLVVSRVLPKGEPQTYPI